MNFKITIRILISILFLVSGARGQSLDDAIGQQMEKRHVLGSSIAMVRSGKIVLSKGYGFTDIERSIPVTPDTPFAIGSVSKQFTATAMMMLVEEGKAALDDRAVRYLPDLPAAYHEITVRHLLTHTSGIKRDFKVFGQSLIGEKLYSTMSKAPLDFTPGEQTSYSNTNFVLVGLIVESVSKKGYCEFISERIFKPIGMTATRCFLPEDKMENHVSGYEWNRNAFHRVTRVPVRYGAGAIASTVVDMAKWDAALYSEKLVKQKTLAQMWSPIRLNNGKTAMMGYDYAARMLNVGMGWFISDDLGRKVIHHGGEIDGFSSQIERFVNDKVTIIVLCNNEAGSPASVLAKLIADRHVPNLDQNSIPSLNQKFQFAYQQGQHAEAVKFNLAAIAKGDTKPVTFYNTACSFSLLGEKDQAFSLLEKAIDSGFSDAALLMRDTDLKPLRDDPRWAQIVNRMNAKVKR